MLAMVANGLHISSSAFPQAVNQSILHHFQQHPSLQTGLHSARSSIPYAFPSTFLFNLPRWILAKDSCNTRFPNCVVAVVASLLLMLSLEGTGDREHGRKRNEQERLAVM